MEGRKFSYPLEIILLSWKIRTGQHPKKKALKTPYSVATSTNSFQCLICSFWCQCKTKAVILCKRPREIILQPNQANLSGNRFLSLYMTIWWHLWLKSPLLHRWHASLREKLLGRVQKNFTCDLYVIYVVARSRPSKLYLWKPKEHCKNRSCTPMGRKITLGLLQEGLTTAGLIYNYENEGKKTKRRTYSLGHLPSTILMYY